MVGFTFRNANKEEIVIHAFCRCIVTRNGRILVNSNDMVKPAKGVKRRDDDDYPVLGCVFDWEVAEIRQKLPLTVLAIEADADGRLTVRLDRDYNLTITPWTNALENWRIFRPDSDEPHWVYYGNGTFDTGDGSEEEG